MKILHVFRAPAGGLFRHVRDLAMEQTRAGHEVGLICDSTSGGKMADETLKSLAPRLALGIERLPMPRLPGMGDLRALRAIRARVRARAPDIVHGHGAKGGLHARLSARAANARAVYTAHGGSLHYSWKSPQGALFLGAERLLLARTDGLIFVCDFERRAFETKIGQGKCPRKVIHNGLSKEDFAAIPPNPDAADLLFIGELRMLKGVDVLIKAIALLKDRGKQVCAVIVGDGPDRKVFEELIARHGLQRAITMPGAMPAARAFPLGRIMIVPSRAESFPYVVLEAQAAARPLIASDVGGIGEMLPATAMIPPDDPAALAAAVERALEDDGIFARAKSRQNEIRDIFSAPRMAQQTLAFYDSLL